LAVEIINKAETRKFGKSTRDEIFCAEGDILGGISRVNLYHFCQSRILAMRAFEVLTMPCQKDGGDGIKWEKEPR
jgi:hypothetical protein